MAASGETRTRSARVQPRVAVLLLLLLISQAVTVRPSTAEVASSSSSLQPTSAPSAMLRSASGATIEFRTQNDRTVSGTPARTTDLPHLVLYRNGSLTDPHERTLIVEVSGVEVPPGAVTVTLTVTTEHVDPYAAAGLAARIPVWREAHHIASTNGPTETASAVVFTRTFSRTVAIDGKEVPTPTDYFRYSISIDGAETDGAGSVLELEGDYAFLMENQFVASLPKVEEESESAAPDQLVVYYCDMFPFRSRTAEGADRLPRRAIPRFVHDELVPAMVEAFRIQSDDWGFQWHDAWTGYRAEAGPGQLSVALTDGRTWYHGSAPVTGHSGISLNTNAGDEYAPYDTLTDGLVSTFYHELFHNLQRSINQHSGGEGSVDGGSNAWQFFSEGTAILASSVGMTGVHFSPTGSDRRHAANTNAQRAHDALSSGTLRGSTRALYWRFLYEHCGGMKDGVEDPGAGMAVVRNALSALYSGDIADITSSTDLLGGLPRLMDRVLEETPSCRFHTFEESLIQFARAIYALRLTGGRCVAPGLPIGCGFYDPHNLYHTPSVETVAYSGGHQEHSGYVWRSYGIDLVEVPLHPTIDGRSLTLEFVSAQGGQARLSVQVWRLVDGGLDGRPRPIPEQVAGPEVVGTAGPSGRLTYTIPAIDATAYNRLGILVTRVDVNQRSDPLGRYTIRLLPG